MMSTIADMAEKAKTLFLGALDGIGALINRWEDALWSRLRGPLFSGTPGKPGALSWLKGKLVPLLGLLLLTLLAVLLVLIFARGSAGLKDPEMPAVNFGPTPIPWEELFLPEEPDFLPPVILEREQRDSWTAEDAEPFWYNPLKDGEEEWREQVEKTVDEFLERIP
ncbi:MAG: hypothetical protein LBH51_08255 [Treponema sp.]|jgi:hypothetical protein|nr:hypothetical protein [Treponema sp.]